MNESTSDLDRAALPGTASPRRAGSSPVLRGEPPGRRHCPTCGAPRGQDATCYRCKSDLSPLIGLEREADAWRAEARRCYAQGWYRQAAALAQRALRIETSSEDLKLVICACLRYGDFRTVCRTTGQLLDRGSGPRGSATCG